MSKHLHVEDEKTVEKKKKEVHKYMMKVIRTTSRKVIQKRERETEAFGKRENTDS